MQNNLNLTGARHNVLAVLSPREPTAPPAACAAHSAPIDTYEDNAHAIPSAVRQCLDDNYAALENIQLPTTYKAKIQHMHLLLRKFVNILAALQELPETQRTQTSAVRTHAEDALRQITQRYKSFILDCAVQSYATPAQETLALQKFESNLATIVQQASTVQADLLKKIQNLPTIISAQIDVIEADINTIQYQACRTQNPDINNFATHLRSLSLLVLQEQQEQHKEGILGNLFTCYLQIQGECYHATTNQPHQPFRWLGMGNQIMYLNQAQRQYLLHQCGGRILRHNPSFEDANLKRLSHGRQHLELYNMCNHLHKIITNHPDLISLVTQVGALELPFTQSILDTTSIIAPLHYVLPSTLIEQGLHVLDQTKPTLNFCNTAEHKAYKKLGRLVQQAQKLDNESRAEGAPWLQVAHLLVHEKTLRQLSENSFKQMDLLRQRCLERDELAQPSSVKPAARKTPSARQKKAVTKAPQSSCVPPPLPLEITNATETLTENIAQVTLAAPPSVERQAFVEPQFATTWQLVNHAKQQSQTIQLRQLADVTLYSRLPAEALKKLLVETVEPSVWAMKLPNSRRWYQVARSLVPHAAKHTLPGTAIEDWIKAGLQLYDVSSAQLSARADRLLEKVQTIRTTTAYAVFSCEGKLITYCNRSLCGATHYPKAAPQAVA